MAKTSAKKIKVQEVQEVQEVTPAAVQTPAINMSKYEHLTTKSAKIRAMRADGFTTGAISKALNIRYQHARNVIIQPLKRVENVQEVTLTSAQ
jgi:hypothetical protein